VTGRPVAQAVAPALRSLLRGIVDYAGLFPPAALDLATTARHYAAYLRGEHAWMLGHLVVPAGRLAELAPHLPRSGTPWSLSAVTAPAGDPGLERDLAAVAAFNERHVDPQEGLARIEAVELKAAEAGTIDRALRVIPDELFPFFEIPVDADPRGLIAALAGTAAGAKVRTGGPGPDSIPTPRRLARFVAAAAAAAVPFKATAGLHHPLRHRAQDGAEEFGFLGLFAAATAASCGAAEDELVAMLQESSPQRLRFGDALVFGERTLARERIEQARQTLALSFGSCSFEEPIEHLRGLGLL
jgi:hypothetical protein